MKYEWLLFDADGTLFDYDRAEATALQRTFEQAGQRFEPAFGKVYRRINHQIWLDFERGRISQARLRAARFERLFDAIGIELDVADFSRRYLENLAQGTYLVDGAQGVVAALHGRVGLMLITNGIGEVQRPRFASSALRDYFADLVISEEVGVAKPDPAIFDVAFEKMGRPSKEDVLMIGDSLTSDIRGGNNYGIDTCWFNPRGRAPDQDVEIRYEIRDLRELLGVIGAPEGQDG